MKNKNMQHGFSHVVIVIIIVVAVLGALGVILWRNLSDKNTNSTNETTSQLDLNDEVEAEVSAAVDSTVKTDNTTKVEAKTETETDTDHLALSKWGVKFKLPAINDTILYYSSNDGSSYSFTTKKVEALGESCTVQSDETGLRVLSGLITRSSTKKTDLASIAPINNGEKIGDYYYYYQAPQSPCASDTKDPGFKIQTASSNAISEMLRNPILIK